MQLWGSLNILWHCLSLGLEWKLTFSSPVATAVFQICWHIECSTSTASSFRIWNSSTGIPTPPLALFVVMLLPKAHLTSHSRMSGSRWVITPSWLSGSLRYFLYSSSVYSCYLFLITSASVSEVKPLSPVWLFATPWTVAYQALQSVEFSRQEYWSGLPFPVSVRSIPFMVLSLHEMFPWYLWFSWRDPYSFPFYCVFSISLHWSLRKAFLSLLAILWNSAFKYVFLSFSPLPFLFFSFAFCFSSSHSYL